MYMPAQTQLNTVKMVEFEPESDVHLSKPSLNSCHDLSGTPAPPLGHTVPPQLSFLRSAKEDSGVCIMALRKACDARTVQFAPVLYANGDARALAR